MGVLIREKTIKKKTNTNPKTQKPHQLSILKHPRCGSRSHNYSSCAIAVYGSQVPAGVMELGVRIMYYTYLV